MDDNKFHKMVIVQNCLRK